MFACDVICAAILPYVKDGIAKEGTAWQSSDSSGATDTYNMYQPILFLKEKLLTECDQVAK